MVDRLRIDQVVVGSREPATAPDHSAGNPHRDSKATGIARLQSGGFFGQWQTAPNRPCNDCATEKGNLIMQTEMHRRTR